MKRLLKKFTVMAVLVSLALTGCKSTKEEGTVEKEENEKAGIVVVTHPLSCVNNGREVVTGKYPEVKLSKKYQKKYPQLWEELSNTNMGWAVKTKEEISGLGGVEPEESREEPYVSDATIQVLRFDKHLLILELDYYDETGGAHPNHGCTTMNYDPSTGNFVELADTLTDSDSFAATIRKAMEKEYDEETMQAIDEYYYYDEDTDSSPDPFQNHLDKDTYSWVINEKGLTIFFSPYDIAPYAYGDISVELSYEDYPDLIKEKYRLDEAQNLSSLVEYKEDEVETVLPEEQNYLGDDEESEAWTLDNPSWSYYVDDAQKASSHTPISLTEISREESDFLDLYTWTDKYGFSYADPCYGTDEYSYLPMYKDDNSYEYTRLRVYPANEDGIVCEFDLSKLCDGPDSTSGTTSKVNQTIRYEAIVGDILYVEISHYGYAYEEKNTAYIVGIDLETGNVLFKTEPLTANASNFQIYDDFIICGYGFTSEDDYLYILDRYTGKRINSIPLRSAANQIEVVDDILYVATYNTAYQFKITQ